MDLTLKYRIRSKSASRSYVISRRSYVNIWTAVLPLLRPAIARLHEYAALTIGIYSTLGFAPWTTQTDHVATMRAAWTCGRMIAGFPYRCHRSCDVYLRDLKWNGRSTSQLLVYITGTGNERCIRYSAGTRIYNYGIQRRYRSYSQIPRAGVPESTTMVGKPSNQVDSFNCQNDSGSKLDYCMRNR